MTSDGEALGKLQALIHEAAFVPEKWVSFIDEAAAGMDSGNGVLGIYWPEPKRVFGTRNLSEQPPEEWDQDPRIRTTWAAYVRAKSMINAGFFTAEIGQDWSDVPDHARRVERNIRRNAGSQLGSIYELFNGELITVEFAKIRGGGPYTAQEVARMNVLDGNLRRTMLFASRFYFERARGSVDAMKIIGIPALLVGGGKRVLYCNSMLDSVKGVLTSLPGETLGICGDERTKRTFARALAPSCEDSVTIAVAETSENDAAIVHVMPLLGGARDIFASSYKMVLVTSQAGRRRAPCPAGIMAMFGLTQAEANLAVSLASGLSLRDSAAKANIGVGTARSYLLRIFSKTQTNQQSQLVSLLMKISL